MTNSFIKSACSPLLVILFILLCQSVSIAAIEFVSPEQGVAISSPFCTLTVKASPDIRYVTFKAHYFGRHGVRENIQTLSERLSQQPFTYVWNLSTIPNQITTGATLIAEARSRYGVDTAVVREGIFLTHVPVTRPEYVIEYSKRQIANRTASIALTSRETTSSGKAQIVWDEDELFFHVEVSDAFFFTSLSQKKYSLLGIDILLDPLLSREAYQSAKSVMYVVPLVGNPYRLYSKPESRPDGSFLINEFTQECANYCSIKQEDFKGYSIDFAIPWKDIYIKGRPERLGFNIVAKALDKDGEIRRLSWVADVSGLYSPLYWGDATMSKPPVLANEFLLWAVSFGGGLAAGVLIFGLIFLTGFRSAAAPRRTPRFRKGDDTVYERIRSLIEAEITNRGLTIESIAEKARMSTQKVDAIIRCFCGESFKMHLMRSRIEIAKERLRSSHSNESAVASTSGFASVDELEKYFKKFCGTTPYRFRENNQIT